jgi:hypothetical protein
MKSIIKKTSVCIIAFMALSACSDEFLNEVPHDQIDLENFFSKPVDAEIGLTGGYAKIISKHTMANLFWFMVSADEVTAANHANSGMGSGDHRDLTTSSLWGMLGTYTVPYAGIVNLNVLLQKVPDIPDSQFAGSRKNEILGEAHFLRGYAYYLLAMVFRDVPLQTEVPTSSNPVDNYMNSSPQSEILDQAMSDFEEAIRIMPDRLSGMSDHDVRGRGSKWAALAFKARIHMWRGEWSEAFNACQAIIDGGQFKITPRWIDIFAGENDNEEVIWQSQGQSREEYDFIGVYRWYCDNDPTAPAPPFMVEKKLTDMFDQPYKDVRLEYSVRAIGRSTGVSNYGGRNVKHFHVPSGEIIEGVSDESRDKNFPLMRLAEVNLMKAEAIIQSGYTLGTADEVLDILNELRTRAADPAFEPREDDNRYDYDANLGCEGIAPLTIDQVNLQALKDEKYRELCMEAVRWIDLLRWSGMEDNYASVMALVNASSVDRLYAAIPQEQIDANHGVLEQNPGYK